APSSSPRSLPRGRPAAAHVAGRSTRGRSPPGPLGGWADRPHEGWWGRYESGTYDRVAPVGNEPDLPIRGEVSLMSASPETPTAPSRPAVTEREARQVAEAAREQHWRKPSFAKELFLGRFRLDLIHPHPLPADEDAQRGEEFLAKLRDFCETKIDGARIEREARIPDEVVTGLKELGAFGMKIDTKYGGLGLTQVYYNKAL